MSELWNTPRGEFLYQVARAGGHPDPDARDYPTDDEQSEITGALFELLEDSSPDQLRDMIGAATDFLQSRGKTIHEFSVNALAQTRRPSDLLGATMSVNPADDRLSIVRTHDLAEPDAGRLRYWQDRQAAPDWSISDLEEEMAEREATTYTTDERTDSFLIGHGLHERTIFVSAKSDDDYMAHQPTDTFTVGDYLEVRHMIAADAGELDAGR